MWSVAQFRINRISAIGIPLLRIWLGLVMIKHSYPVILENGFTEFGDWLSSMGIPLPHFMAYLAKGSEFIGGILMCSGYMIRIAATFIIINMVVAVLVANKGAIFSKAELPFDYLLIALMIFLLGPDKMSLDYLQTKNIKP